MPTSMPPFRSLLCAIAVAAAYASPVDAGEMAKIAQTELLRRLQARDPSLVILDVRAPEEYAEARIPGAINIPHTHLPARIAEIPGAANKDIVVYCTIGKRAASAIERLREHGYTRLLHLDGDMTHWRESKRPLEEPTAP